MANLPPPRYPQVNGVRTDFTSITFLANGAPIPGIVEINYGQELKKGEVFGTPIQQIGRTPGQLKCKADFTMLQLEWNLLIPVLCNLSGGGQTSGYMQAVFDISVQYQLPQSNIIITDVLRGCSVDNHNIANKQGPEALMEKVELSLFYVLKNGASPVVVASGNNPNGMVPG